jgi:hypothetical protein
MSGCTLPARSACSLNHVTKFGCPCETPSGQFLGLIVMSHWLTKVWIRIQDILIVVLFGESCLLFSWCAGGRCGMAGSDEDHGRSRRHYVEDRGWSDTGRVLDGWTIGRSGDAVCGLYHARGDEEHVFLGWASKPRLTGCQWFDLKTTKIVCQWFDLKTTRTVFSGLAPKPVATISPGLPSKPMVASGFLVSTLALYWALGAF